MSSPNAKEFHGVWPALMTPFKDDETINEPALRKHLDWLIERGIHGLFICGSTGECPHLTDAERMYLAEVIVETVKKRVPVMVHVGHTSTAASVTLAKHAERIGADAVSAVPPYYYAANINNALRHWRGIGEAIDIPLYIYRIPIVTDIGSMLPHMKDILAIPNLQGMKFTDTDFFEMMSIIDLAEGKLRVFSGFDEDAVCGLAAGAIGMVGTTYNILPEPFIAIYEAMREQRLDDARALQMRLTRFFRALFATKAGTAAWKVWGDLRGLGLGRCRLPFEWVHGERYDEILEAGRRVGFPDAFMP